MSLSFFVPGISSTYVIIMPIIDGHWQCYVTERVLCYSNSRLYAYKILHVLLDSSKIHTLVCPQPMTTASANTANALGSVYTEIWTLRAQIQINYCVLNHRSVQLTRLFGVGKRSGLLSNTLTNALLYLSERWCCKWQWIYCVEYSSQGLNKPSIWV